QIVEVVDERPFIEAAHEGDVLGRTRLEALQQVGALLAHDKLEARNWADWKPDAVSSRLRNAANDIGVIVSRMSSWPTTVFITVRARLSVAIAPKRSFAVKSRLILSSSWRRSLNHSS